MKLNREYQITVLLSSHILDELARLATHYGFLDQGTLVREVSAQELEAACRRCVRLTVTDAKTLCRVLDGRGLEYRLAGEGEADVYEAHDLSQLILDLHQAGLPGDRAPPAGRDFGELLYESGGRWQGCLTSFLPAPCGRAGTGAFGAARREAQGGPCHEKFMFRPLVSSASA